jgi:uncharacterized membrane protein
MKFASWLAGFFDESTPQSFSRLITLIIVAAVIVWCSVEVVHTHKVVSAETFLGLMTASSVFYFIRRTAGAVESVESTRPQNGLDNSDKK